MGWLSGIGKGVLAGVSGAAKAHAASKAIPEIKTSMHGPGDTLGRSRNIPSFLYRKPKSRPTISNSRGMKGGAMTLTGKR